MCSSETHSALSFFFFLLFPFQVITPEQIWVGVMERGPAGVTLNSGFKSRENVDYVVSSTRTLSRREGPSTLRPSLSGAIARFNPGAHAPSAFFFCFLFPQNDLGNALVNMSRVVPDGLLVFFPSYAVLASCSAAWKQSGPGGKPSILEAIQSKKAVTHTHALIRPRRCARREVDFGLLFSHFFSIALFFVWFVHFILSACC